MTTKLVNTCLILSVLVISMSGCHTQSQTAPVGTSQSEPSAVNDINEPISNSNTQDDAVIDSAVIDKASVDKVSVDAAVIEVDSDNVKKDCYSVTKRIEDIDANSKIEAIDNIDTTLPACLASSDNETVTRILEAYTDMYDRFLGLDDDEIIEQLSQFMNELARDDDFKTVSLKGVTPPRLQYLLTLAQTDDTIDVFYWGEGTYSLSYDLDKTASLFTPYLPEADQVFIQRMAKDNQTLFWNDASIDIAYSELIERALFWERYISDYPQSPYLDDAQHLYDFYRHSLFFGSPNSYWTDDAMHHFIDSQYRSAMTALASRPNSQLAKDAQKYLHFLTVPDEVRQQTYPVEPVDKDGYKRSPLTITTMQLDQALQLPSPWSDDYSKNCLKTVICKDQ